MPAQIYIASKTKHADRWRALRAGGAPIISSWIDEDEPTSYPEFWGRCLREIAHATSMVLYHEEGEVPKGSFVEVGAALAHLIPVFVVGDPPGTFVHYPLVKRRATVEEAIASAVSFHEQECGRHSEWSKR